MKDFKDHSQLKFWICTNWLSIQKQPSGAFPLRECSVSVQRIYREALIRRYGFNKVAYASLWGSLFHMSGLLWLFCRICRALFSGRNASRWLFLTKHLSLITQFLLLYYATDFDVSDDIVIMFLWKPFDYFLMKVLFCLHLVSFEYCFLFINYLFSHIFSGLSKSSHLSFFVYPCQEIMLYDTQEWAYSIH